MRGIMFGAILLVMISLMWAGQEERQGDLDVGKTLNPYFSTAEWDYNETDSAIERVNEELNKTVISSGALQNARINAVMHKFIDFLGFSLTEMGKWALEFGYTHPQYDFGFMQEVIMWWFYIILVSYVFPVLVPACVVIYLLGLAIYKGIVWVGMKIEKKKK